ncbi:MAG: ADP-ribosylglycohydrolase family protein [Clostridia bacterium]|nr:ADP-ribosylglycohydrolase family protein [Clostridia bacterium]
MELKKTIYALREREGMTQERFAEILGVSRQAVQKWEAGVSAPEIKNLIAIAKNFHISMDALILGSNDRLVDELTYDKVIQPEYSSIHVWDSYSEQLKVEFIQCLEEGLNIGNYEDLFLAVSKMPKGQLKDAMADQLFLLVLNSSLRPEYSYTEPSSLEDIRLLCTFRDHPAAIPSRKKLEDKLRGAWLGRIAGCLLGKPVEGCKTEELIPFLKDSDNYPMHRYILSTDVPEDADTKYQFRFAGRCYPDTISAAPVDDDTNYTVLAQCILDLYGKDFTPYDVSRAWLSHQPKNAYCTAERVAFRNFVMSYTPPNSAVYKNPYREWIGAQIRADYYGYINPGNPTMAAEMAWRDASISHVKNGIYGAMFVAAMLAEAAVNSDLLEILQCGLSQIPSTSRLHDRISRLIHNYQAGVTQKQCFKSIHTRYDEHRGHDWCHTISNAEIVVASLLYGKGDFGTSVCMAVEAGFDTDCNGATVGSILGMRGGAASIDKKWTDPIRNRLETSIFGVGTVTVDDLINKTLEHTLY